MRIIKFRAFHKKEKKMYPVFGINYDIDGNITSILLDIRKRSVEGWVYPIEIANLMQSTGLRDRHGKEIYEGDILKCDNAGNREVFFDDASYFTRNKYKGKKSIHFLTNDPKYYEVIGNIYENKKLLKGGDNDDN